MENKFLTQSSADDIHSISGIGNGEKASKLLQSIAINLKCARDKNGWLSKFISIFSSKAVYEDLAAIMRRKCQLGR